MRFARLTEHHFHVFRDSGCPASYFYLWAFLILHQNQPGQEVYPSYARISKETGVPVKSIERHIAALKRYDLIKTTKLGKRNFYALKYVDGYWTTPNTEGDEAELPPDSRVVEGITLISEGSSPSHLSKQPPNIEGSPPSKTRGRSREGREKEERSERGQETSPITGPPEEENLESIGNILEQSELLQSKEPGMTEEDARQIATRQAERRQTEILQAHQRRKREKKEEAHLTTMRKRDPEKFAAYIKDKTGKIGKMP